LLISPKAKVFKYAIRESPLPIRNYLGTVQVLDAAGGKTELTWSARFDVGDAQRDEMVSMLNGAFADGIQGLEKDLKTRK